MLYKLDQVGKDFIANQEGVRYRSYKDSVGLDTTGIGHLINLKTERHLLTKVLNKQEVYELFEKDIKYREQQVSELVKVKLTQNQFNAIFSLVFNIGVEAFKQSTLLKLLNMGMHKEACSQFIRWNKETKNGVLVPSFGLTRRRNEEMKLFNKS